MDRSEIKFDVKYFTIFKGKVLDLILNLHCLDTHLCHLKRIQMALKLTELGTDSSDK